MPESNQLHRSPPDRPSRPLVVVSNREPYLHSLAEDGAVTWEPTTGGVAVFAAGEVDRQRAVVDGGVAVANTLAAQQFADGAGVHLKALGQRGVHIHFQ